MVCFSKFLIFKFKNFFFFSECPVRCPKCDKTFSNRYNLNQHLTRHLYFKYKCGHCQMMFGTKRYMHLHQQSAHNMIFKNLFPDKKRSPRKRVINTRKFQPIEYKCLKCDLTFISNMELWDHLRALHF
jgi:DNA-directed RNA polymerase subunit RPC12/RpoP